MNMFAYISGRRMGKTEAVVNWLLADPERRTIIVANRQRQQHIVSTIGRKVRYSRGKGYWLERVVIFDLRYNQMRGRYPGEVAIDDLDEVLQLIFQPGLANSVTFITMTATCIQDFTENENSEGEYIDGDAWPANEDALDATRYMLDGLRGARPKDLPRRLPELPFEPSSGTSD